jgi:hypothetical protein
MIGLMPEAILAATSEQLGAVEAGIQPADRVHRVRRCAELRLAGATCEPTPASADPGVERIDCPLRADGAAGLGRRSLAEPYGKR